MPSKLRTTITIGPRTMERADDLIALRREGENFSEFVNNIIKELWEINFGKSPGGGTAEALGDTMKTPKTIKGFHGRLDYPAPMRRNGRNGHSLANSAPASRSAADLLQSAQKANLAVARAHPSPGPSSAPAGTAIRRAKALKLPDGIAAGS
jgi:hypothetical protein